MKDMLLDIRYALRVLWKSPAFTLVALLTLMLGIGANVVVFGVVNAVLLQPVEASDPQNLYQLRLKPWTSFKLLTTSYPAFEDIRQRNTTFSDIAGFYGFCQARLRWGNVVRDVSGYAVTGNYFDLLGVQPAIGRFFQAADEHGPNSAAYIVLSDSLWRSAFNGDPGVVGTTVRLYNDPFTVIGVAPARFHGTDRFDWPDYYIPIVNYFDAAYLQNRTGRPLTVLGRLNPGVTPQQATENLNAIAAQLAKEYPQTDNGVPLRLIHPGLYGDAGDVIRGFLYSVAGLALVLLVAACANLASLFAARAADRSRELALRLALGASRWRLVRQLLTEAIVLSMLGGTAGLVIAGLLLRVLNQPLSPYGRLAASVDARVYLAALFLTLVSALLFGMIPARQMSQSSPLQAMKSGPVDSTPLRRFTLRDLLLGAQIAICTLLVTASLVAVRGMVRMLQAPLGFQPQGAMLANIDLSEIEQRGDALLVKQKAMLEAVQRIPGVTTAGAVNRVPFTGGLRGVPVFPPGTTDFNLNNSVLAPYVFTMSPGYLKAASTRLLSGRDISWHDTKTTPYVAIVNQTFARKMWGETPAIGQRFILRDHLTEVVGVAEDGKYYEIMEPQQPVVFLPLFQTENGVAVFVVRTTRAQNEMVTALERTLSAIEPNALITVQSWPDAMAGVLFPARAASVGLGVMGLLAAMLAVTGIFGMAAYNVSRRMKELGIRVALGARTRHVMNAALGRPIVLLGLGSLAGLLLGVFARRLLEHIVYQANPRDPVVVVGAVLTMALLGIAASAIPALRAVAVDPSKLLREE
ncbi:MAG TPA: ABC transporter permease [Candidatus Udaeobacter sp.]|nr:ABC transporter permease [Candidatus Udaeobacter sp.]